jgi:succinoglycan biosynthesis protein ExoA
VSRDLSEQPAVSAIIPCRNESKFIAACLASVLANGYPLDHLEILVIDGLSTDGTREVVRGLSAGHPEIRLIDNPEAITPAALNIGIAGAKGELVIRLDAHATYERGYIEQCVDALARYDVGNSGGVWRIMPRREGLVGRAVVCALNHRFGGAARYRLAKAGEPEFVDLVPFFCCRRETLRMVGRFNERLLRHQDFEHSMRMRRAGVKFVLVPNAVCNYYTRSDLRSFWSHSFRDGLWVTLAAVYTDVIPVSIRHLIPMLFALVLITGMAVAPFSTTIRWTIALVLAVYLMVAFICAARIATEERDLRMLALMPVVFFGRHLLFGVGALIGAVRALMAREFWRNHRFGSSSATLAQ